MARDNPSCSQVLPCVLLGPRTDDRKKLAAIPANLIYMENLRLSGIIVLDKGEEHRESELLHLLRDAIPRLKPPPPSPYAWPAVHTPEKLEVCSHVLARIDTIRRCCNIIRSFL